MSNFVILCGTVAVIVLIAGVLGTIEKCSYYKHKAANPEAFMDEEV